jgi:hypothetical protein
MILLIICEGWKVTGERLKVNGLRLKVKGERLKVKGLRRKDILFIFSESLFLF